jgi:hypothetical protein
LNDNEIKNHRELLQGAQFVFLRDTDSKRALEASGFQVRPLLSAQTPLLRSISAMIMPQSNYAECDLRRSPA